jgi:hypothetical protein
VNHRGLNQLLCAAVVNERFRATLLRNPAQALEAGYLDQSFVLTPEEQALVVGIRAGALEEFAAQVHSWISGNGRVPGETLEWSIGHVRTASAGDVTKPAQIRPLSRAWRCASAVSSSVSLA